MNNFVGTLICSAVLFTGTASFATEPVASPAENDTADQKSEPDRLAKQDAAMRECLAQHKAGTPPTSDGEAERACKAQLRPKPGPEPAPAPAPAKPSEVPAGAQTDKAALKK